MKLLYPTSLALDIESLKGFAPSLHSYDVKKPIPDDLIDADILITWCNSPDNLKDAAKRMKNLKWIQSLAAGPNDVLSAGFDSGITVCTGSGLHDHTVAEHALGLLLNAARRFYEMRDYQLRLRGANVLIWGYGNIGKTLTPHLISLGAHVRGVARSAGVRDGVEVLGEDQLAKALPETDALVMILPGSESTKNALNAERLKQLPNHAWVVNCLGEGRDRGAALDVFVTEPLPKDSKLWKAPNCVVSPHAAGGRPQESEALIAYNLRRFLAGQELKNVI
ncbi:hypothetical protein H2203_000986 [Taxawa tesnikishii (nom. ined.)]|nr:hypothetical protein H2203_000986 [Dothideales sp. JES 119]